MLNVNLYMVLVFESYFPRPDHVCPSFAVLIGRHDNIKHGPLHFFIIEYRMPVMRMAAFRMHDCQRVVSV